MQCVLNEKMNEHQQNKTNYLTTVNDKSKDVIFGQEKLIEDNIKEQPTLSTSKTTRVVPIKEPAKQPVKMVASKPISVDTRSMSNSFDISLILFSKFLTPYNLP